MKRQFRNREPFRDPRCKNNSNDDSIRFLSLFSVQQFNGNFPTFQLPKTLGSFSLDSYRNYHNDYSELRYLALPDESNDDGYWDVEFDLHKGIEKVIEKDEDSIREKMLDDMLTWILQERAAENMSLVDIQNPLRPLQIEFVCFRGLLTMLITTPYESKENWVIVASKFQNTIFLWDLKDNRNNQNNRMNPKLQAMSIWGFKFEQYLCADSPDSLPNPDKILNTNAEFCCVLKTRLAGHSLLYGAEVDAVKKGCQPPFNSLENFVELKTNRHIETERQSTTFKRFKSMKWWAQSFLVGIPQIVVGYRDDDGIVSRLETIEVKQLRKDCDAYWKANICMNFCQQFLEFVKESIPLESSPNTHYFFEFNAIQKKIIFTCEPIREIRRDLLPSWYVDAMKKPV